MRYYVVVDENNVIKTVEIAEIDPVATRKKASVEMFADPKYQNMASDVLKLNTILEGTKKGSDQYRKTQSLLSSTNHNVNVLFLEYMKSNAVYMNVAPMDGTAIEIDSSKYSSIIEMLKSANDRLLVYGDECKYIENNVGKKYFYQDEGDEWKSYICDSVLEEIPNDWIYSGNLTAEQKEEIRDQNKTDDDRDNEAYSKAFNDFLTRMFMDSQEYSDYVGNGGEKK